MNGSQFKSLEAPPSSLRQPLCPDESIPRWHGYDAVRIILGLVLLAAAALKAHALLTQPLAGTGLLASRGFQIALIEIELLLGLRLLSGLYQRLGWFAALGCFSLFTVVSVSYGVLGTSACGCLGLLPVSPWHMAAFDLAAVGALLIWKPVDPARLMVWKRLPAAAVGAAMIAVPLGPILGARESAPPLLGLVADHYTHDFGLLAPADAGRIEHTFTLRNTSDKPIRIVKSTSTCGCTAPEVPVEPVAPGATTQVPVSVNWGNSSGRRMEQVRLETDDPVTGAIRLRLSGEITAPPAALSPSAIHFGGVRRGESVHRLVRLQSAEHPNLRITGVESSSDLVLVTRIGPDGKADPSQPLEGPAGTFQVTFACDDCTGRQSGRVVFHTNLPDADHQILSVTAEIAPAFEVTPSSIFFTSHEHGETKEIRINVSQHLRVTTPNFEILVPDGDTGAPQFRVEVLKDPECWRVLVIPQLGRPSQVNRATLRMSLGADHVDVPILSIGPSAGEQ